MARTGEARKPVSRKKAANKTKGAQKRRRGSKRPSVSLPRPDKLTLIIVGAGAALLVALWFLVVTPTSNAAANAAEELSEAEATLSRNQRRLDEYESNQTYQGAALTEVVGPVEAFMPFFEDPSAEPATTINEISDSLRSAGLRVGKYPIPSAYTEQDGAKVLTTTFTDVSGSPERVIAWLETLAAWKPLVTFKTGGAAASEGTMTLTVDITVWASPDETYTTGGSAEGETPVDLEEGLGGLTGRPAGG